MVITYGYGKLKFALAGLAPWRPPGRASATPESSTVEVARSIDRQRPKVQSPPVDGASDLQLKRGEQMFDIRDLFQWERFITPSIIKVFYWLAVIVTVLFGLSGILSGLAVMMLQPLPGLFLVFSSVLGMLAGVILIRILSEFVLITFRINEHLGAIRNRGQL
jgi:hypothetical protein